MANKTTQEFRDRFHAAKDKVAAIQAKSAPLHEQRNALRVKTEEAHKNELAVVSQIKSVEEPLYDLQNEMAAMSRALSGKTGTTANPDDEPVAEEPADEEQKANA